MKLTTGIRASIFFGSWVVFAIPAAPAEAQQAIITTIAGTGTPGYSGGNDLAITANIKAAAGVAVDSAGNLFIADTDNNAVRRVDADTQIITIYAGTPGS